MAELLSGLSGQTVPPDEVIIADSMSTDRTVPIAIASGTVLLPIERLTFDHGGTRNYAASRASGDILIYMTQDALPADIYFIERIIAPFEDEGVAAVGGRQVPRSDAHVLERRGREFNYPSEPMKKTYADIKRYGIKTFFLSNVCAAYRADVFHQLGGFAAPMVSNEDMLIAAKIIEAGYTIAYSPDAKVIHSHNYTLRQLFTRYFDIGGSLQLHHWILDYAKPEREGFKLMRRQLSFLLSPAYWRWIPRWFAESVAKYVGYRLGLSHHKLPARFRKKCSMHPFFWDRVTKKPMGGATLNEKA